VSDAAALGSATFASNGFAASDAFAADAFAADALGDDRGVTADGVAVASCVAGTLVTPGVVGRRGFRVAAVRLRGSGALIGGTASGVLATDGSVALGASAMPVDGFDLRLRGARFFAVVVSSLMRPMSLS